MAERQDLLASIASTIKDYRSGEIAEPTADHVGRWISQFGDDVQIAMLRELDDIFKRTYCSKDKVVNLLRTLAHHPPNRSTQSACSFWQHAEILDIQQNGESQSIIRNLFGGVVHFECGLDIDQITPDGNTFIYLDDALFTGNRIIRDLNDWMPRAPAKATVYVCVFASHPGGEHWCQMRVSQIADQHGKEIDLRFWKFYSFENRKYFRNGSGVLWPTAEVYNDYGFEPRRPGNEAIYPFATERGRQLLEREFLNTGLQIQGFANNPSPVLKPLGFYNFNPGFGSLFATYRNCPNNCPLALWYGDPSHGPNHPLGRWYPLLSRKTYYQ